MIPKKIHYCWFGRKELPEKAKRCIESWKNTVQSMNLLNGMRIIQIFL